MKEYFIHNIYMAEIGNAIVNDKLPLDEVSKIYGIGHYQKGVREIIGLYLLIPYINNSKNQLQYKTRSQMSIFNDERVVFRDIKGRDIKLKNLRDTICHSFASCELKKEPLLDDCIVFDDRILYDRRQEHEPGDGAVLVKCEDVLSFLRKAFSEVIDLYNKDSNN